MFLLTGTYSIFHSSPSVEAEKRHYSMRDHYTVVCVWMFRGHESTINSQRRLFWSDPFPYWVDLNEMEPRQTPGRRVVLSFSFTGKDIDWYWSCWEALNTIDHICFFQTIMQKSSLHPNTFWSFLVSPTFLLQRTSSLVFYIATLDHFLRSTPNLFLAEQSFSTFRRSLSFNFYTWAENII